jgi:hypothetical protein
MQSIIMSQKSGIFLPSCIVLSTLIFQLPAAWGATVSIDTRAISNNGDVLPLQALGATLDLLAFSQQDKKINQVTFNSVTGMPAPPLGGGIAVGKGRDLRNYFPPVGFRFLQPKPNLAKVSSETGTAKAEAKLGASQIPGSVAALTVSASVPNFQFEGQTGRAAAEAIDPSILAPGTYNYSYSINALELGIEAQNELAGASFFATDSRFSNPLWNLSVVTKGTLVTSDDLIIDFVSNPILGLDDNIIENQIQSAFNVSSGIATLNSFQVFSTTYFVDREITFSEGINGGVEKVSVPEPSFLLSLLGFGALGISCLLKPSKSSEKETTKVG